MFASKKSENFFLCPSILMEHLFDLFTEKLLIPFDAYNNVECRCFILNRYKMKYGCGNSTTDLARKKPIVLEL